MVDRRLAGDRRAESDGGSGRGRRLVAAALAAGMAALGGSVFHRVFGWGALAPVVGVASAGPLLLAVLTGGARRQGRPLWIAVAVAAAGWPLVVSATLFRGGAFGGLLPTAGTARATAAGLRDCWAGMLTTIPPVGARPDLLVGVHLLTWSAAAAGVELALRAPRRVAGAVPGLVLFAVALPFAAGGAGSNLPAAITALAATGLLAAGSRRGAVVTRPRALTGVLVAGLALGAGVAGPWLTAHRTAYSPRLPASRAAPSALAVNPLDELPAWSLRPDTVLLTVTANTPVNLRLAVLTDFDGVTWSPPTLWSPSGGQVPAAAGAGASRRVTQDITVAGLTGPWLAAADRPATVTGAGTVDVDLASGALLAARTPRPGTRYRVLSQVPVYATTALRTAAPATDPAGLRLPRTAAVTALAALARQATAGATFPYQQAVLLADYLRGHETADPAAAPGHTLRHLQFFLTTSHQGTSEQFATAFAVLARTLGLPSRVVVGFPVTARHQQVRAGDALAWPEVELRGLGWVPFYPTPTATPAGDGAPVPVGEPASRAAQDRSLAASPASRPSTTAPFSAPPHRPSPHQTRPAKHTPLWPVASGLPVAAYLAGVTLLPRWRRHRRRNAPTPAASVAGAWRQTLLDLSAAGVPTPPTRTARELAHHGIAALGPAAAPHLLALADTINSTWYDPEPPSPSAARTAWHHHAALARLIRAATPRHTRLIHQLAPGRLIS